MAGDPYQARLWRARYRARMKAKAKAWVLCYLMQHPCVDCGEPDTRVLEFDHVDPASKSHNVSRMVADGRLIRLIEQEVAKCEVRCANCHRRRSLDEGHGGFRRM